MSIKDDNKKKLDGLVTTVQLPFDNYKIRSLSTTKGLKNKTNLTAYSEVGSMVEGWMNSYLSFFQDHDDDLKSTLAGMRIERANLPQTLTDNSSFYEQYINNTQMRNKYAEMLIVDPGSTSNQVDSFFTSYGVTLAGDQLEVYKVKARKQQMNGRYINQISDMEKINTFKLNKHILNKIENVDLAKGERPIIVNPKVLTSTNGSKKINQLIETVNPLGVHTTDYGDYYGIFRGMFSAAGSSIGGSNGVAQTREELMNLAIAANQKTIAGQDVANFNEFNTVLSFKGIKMGSYRNQMSYDVPVINPDNYLDKMHGVEFRGKKITGNILRSYLGIDIQDSDIERKVIGEISRNMYEAQTANEISKYYNFEHQTINKRAILKYIQEEGFSKKDGVKPIFMANAEDGKLILNLGANTDKFIKRNPNGTNEFTSLRVIVDSKLNDATTTKLREHFALQQETLYHALLPVKMDVKKNGIDSKMNVVDYFNSQIRSIAKNPNRNPNAIYKQKMQVVDDVLSVYRKEVLESFNIYETFEQYEGIKNGTLTSENDAYIKAISDTVDEKIALVNPEILRNSIMNNEQFNLLNFVNKQSINIQGAGRLDLATYHRIFGEIEQKGQRANQSLDRVEQAILNVEKQGDSKGTYDFSFNKTFTVLQEPDVKVNDVVKQEHEIKKYNIKRLHDDTLKELTSKQKEKLGLIPNLQRSIYANSVEGFQDSMAKSVEGLMLNTSMNDNKNIKIPLNTLNFDYWKNEDGLYKIAGFETSEKSEFMKYMFKNLQDFNANNLAEDEFQREFLQAILGEENFNHVMHARFKEENGKLTPYFFGKEIQDKIQKIREPLGDIQGQFNPLMNEEQLTAYGEASDKMAMEYNKFMAEYTIAPNKNGDKIDILNRNVFNRGTQTFITDSNRAFIEDVSAENGFLNISIKGLDIYSEGSKQSSGGIKNTGASTKLALALKTDHGFVNAQTLLNEKATKGKRGFFGMHIARSMETMYLNAVSLGEYDNIQENFDSFNNFMRENAFFEVNVDNKIRKVNVFDILQADVSMNSEKGKVLNFNSKYLGSIANSDLGEDQDYVYARLMTAIKENYDNLFGKPLNASEEGILGQTVWNTLYNTYYDWQHRLDENGNMKLSEEQIERSTIFRSSADLYQVSKNGKTDSYNLSKIETLKGGVYLYLSETAGQKETQARKVDDGGKLTKLSTMVFAENGSTNAAKFVNESIEKNYGENVQKHILELPTRTAAHLANQYTGNTGDITVDTVRNFIQYELKDTTVDLSKVTQANPSAVGVQLKDYMRRSVFRNVLETAYDSKTQSYNPTNVLLDNIEKKVRDDIGLLTKKIEDNSEDLFVGLLLKAGDVKEDQVKSELERFSEIYNNAETQPSIKKAVEDFLEHYKTTKQYEAKGKMSKAAENLIPLFETLEKIKEPASVGFEKSEFKVNANLAAQIAEIFETHYKVEGNLSNVAATIIKNLSGSNGFMYGRLKDIVETGKLPFAISRISATSNGEMVFNRDLHNVGKLINANLSIKETLPLIKEFKDVKMKKKWVKKLPYEAENFVNNITYTFLSKGQDQGKTNKYLKELGMDVVTKNLNLNTTYEFKGKTLHKTEKQLFDEAIKEAASFRFDYNNEYEKSLYDKFKKLALYSKEKNLFVEDYDKKKEQAQQAINLLKEFSVYHSLNNNESFRKYQDIEIIDNMLEPIKASKKFKDAVRASLIEKIEPNGTFLEKVRENKIQASKSNYHKFGYLLYGKKLSDDFENNYFKRQHLILKQMGVTWDFENINNVYAAESMMHQTGYIYLTEDSSIGSRISNAIKNRELRNDYSVFRQIDLELQNVIEHTDNHSEKLIATKLQEQVQDFLVGHVNDAIVEVANKKDVLAQKDIESAFSEIVFEMENLSKRNLETIVSAALANGTEGDFVKDNLNIVPKNSAVVKMSEGYQLGYYAKQEAVALNEERQQIQKVMKKIGIKEKNINWRNLTDNVEYYSLHDREGFNAFAGMLENYRRKQRDFEKAVGLIWGHQNQREVMNMYLKGQMEDIQELLFSQINIMIGDEKQWQKLGGIYKSLGFDKHNVGMLYSARNPHQYMNSITPTRAVKLDDKTKSLSFIEKLFGHGTRLDNAPANFFFIGKGTALGKQADYDGDTFQIFKLMLGDFVGNKVTRLHKQKVLNAEMELNYLISNIVPDAPNRKNLFNVFTNENFMEDHFWKNGKKYVAKDKYGELFLAAQKLERLEGKKKSDPTKVFQQTIRQRAAAQRFEFLRYQRIAEDENEEHGVITKISRALMQTKDPNQVDQAAAEAMFEKMYWKLSEKDRNIIAQGLSLDYDVNLDRFDDIFTGYDHVSDEVRKAIQEKLDRLKTLKERGDVIERTEIINDIFKSAKKNNININNVWLTKSSYGAYTGIHRTGLVHAPLTRIRDFANFAADEKQLRHVLKRYSDYGLAKNTEKAADIYFIKGIIPTLSDTAGKIMSFTTYGTAIENLAISSKHGLGGDPYQALNTVLSVQKQIKTVMSGGTGLKDNANGPIFDFKKSLETLGTIMTGHLNQAENMTFQDKTILKGTLEEHIRKVFNITSTEVNVKGFIDVFKDLKDLKYLETENQVLIDNESYVKLLANFGTLYLKAGFEGITQTDLAIDSSVENDKARLLSYAFHNREGGIFSNVGHMVGNVKEKVFNFLNPNRISKRFTNINPADGKTKKTTKESKGLIGKVIDLISGHVDALEKDVGEVAETIENVDTQQVENVTEEIKIGNRKVVSIKKNTDSIFLFKKVPTQEPLPDSKGKDLINLFDRMLNLMGQMNTEEVDNVIDNVPQVENATSTINKLNTRIDTAQTGLFRLDGVDTHTNKANQPKIGLQFFANVSDIPTEELNQKVENVNKVLTSQTSDTILHTAIPENVSESYSNTSQLSFDFGSKENANQLTLEFGRVEKVTSDIGTKTQIVSEVPPSRRIESKMPSLFLEYKPTQENKNTAAVIIDNAVGGNNSNSFLVSDIELRNKGEEIISQYTGTPNYAPNFELDLPQNVEDIDVKPLFFEKTKEIHSNNPSIQEELDKMRSLLEEYGVDPDVTEEEIRKLKAKKEAELKAAEEAAKNAIDSAKDTAQNGGATVMDTADKASDVVEEPVIQSNLNHKASRPAPEVKSKPKAPEFLEKPKKVMPLEDAVEVATETVDDQPFFKKHDKALKIGLGAIVIGTFVKLIQGNRSVIELDVNQKQYEDNEEQLRQNISQYNINTNIRNFY